MNEHEHEHEQISAILRIITERDSLRTEVEHLRSTSISKLIEERDVARARVNVACTHVEDLRKVLGVPEGKSVLAEVKRVRSLLNEPFSLDQRETNLRKNVQAGRMTQAHADDILQKRREEGDFDVTKAAERIVKELIEIGEMLDEEQESVARLMKERDKALGSEMKALVELEHVRALLHEVRFGRKEEP